MRLPLMKNWCQLQVWPIFWWIFCCLEVRWIPSTTPKHAHDAMRLRVENFAAVFQVEKKLAPVILMVFCCRFFSGNCESSFWERQCHQFLYFFTQEKIRDNEGVSYGWGIAQWYMTCPPFARWTKGRFAAIRKNKRSYAKAAKAESHGEAFKLSSNLFDLGTNLP